MLRVNLILHNTKYREYIERIKQAEETRIFCLHNMEHFLDVARIAVIMNCEEKLDISKEMIYATALLHDIGRFKQYEDGIPHEQASVELAKDILTEAEFAPREQEDILRAIREHGNSLVADEKSLAGIIFRADKASRACFLCNAQKQCNWKEEKKNYYIRY